MCSFKTSHQGCVHWLLGLWYMATCVWGSFPQRIAVVVVSTTCRFAMVTTCHWTMHFSISHSILACCAHVPFVNGTRRCSSTSRSSTRGTGVPGGPPSPLHRQRGCVGDRLARQDKPCCQAVAGMFHASIQRLYIYRQRLHCQAFLHIVLSAAGMLQSSVIMLTDHWPLLGVALLRPYILHGLCPTPAASTDPTLFSRQAPTVSSYLVPCHVSSANCCLVLLYCRCPLRFHILQLHHRGGGAFAPGGHRAAGDVAHAGRHCSWHR